MPESAAGQFVRRARQDTGEGGVDPERATIEVGQGHPDGRAIESVAEPCLALPQCLRGPGLAAMRGGLVHPCAGQFGQRGYQLGRRPRLVQTDVGAGLHRLGLEIAQLEHRQHSDPCLRGQRPDTRDGLQPAHHRHGDIDDGQVGLVRLSQPDRLGPVGGLADDDEAARGLEHGPHQATEVGGVVGQEDANRRVLAR